MRMDKLLLKLVDRQSAFGKHRSFIKLSLLVLILFNTASLSAANDKKALFFTCESGFKFELSQSAARCIKRTKQIFRKPLPCSPLVVNGKKQNRRILIDTDGTHDLCLPSSEQSANHRHSQSEKLKLLPQCPSGFGIFHRPGKDACLQTKREVIKPPTKQTVR